jgi:hypothetical protein
MHTQLISMFAKHAALAAQAANGTLDDAGRADLAKYTAAAEALSGQRPLPAGLVAKAMDAAEFQEWAEAELASGDVDRLAVCKAALDAVAVASAAGLEKFAVNVIPAAPAVAPAPAVDPAALAALIEAAVAKALDARTITGVRVEAPPVEPEPAPVAEEPEPAPEAAPVAKSAWHAGDWARMACGVEDETP